MCTQRMMRTRQLPIEDEWTRARQLCIDNMFTGVSDSTFSAQELDNSRLRTCARELDHFGWHALELDHSIFRK